MTEEIIYINGKPSVSGVAGTDPGRLLKSNYVYASVYTDRHVPLWLERQLHYATLSYAHIHGTIPALDASDIEGQIIDLLARNRKPLTGSVVNIYLIPTRSNGHRPDIVIVHDRTTIYHGYQVRSLRPVAFIANYEIPFSGHRTAVSLTASEYMQHYAAREDAGAVLRANRAGRIVSSGDFPLLAVIDGDVFTPPADDGAGESAEREIMKKVCAMAGITVTEKELAVKDITGMEEIIIFGTEGITSVLSCSGTFFYNLVCDRIEAALPAFNKAGL